MFQVVKRDGEVADFNLRKISSAIRKAFEATGKQYSDEIMELLALRVTADFQEKIQNGRITVEEIQDSVEHVLEQTGYTDVAKAYILYRKQREKIRNMKSTILGKATGLISNLMEFEKQADKAAANSKAAKESKAKETKEENCLLYTSSNDLNINVLSKFAIYICGDNISY